MTNDKYISNMPSIIPPVSFSKSTSDLNHVLCNGVLAAARVHYARASGTFIKDDRPTPSHPTAKR